MSGVHASFANDAEPIIEKDALALLGHAIAWNYDPYERHQCDAARTDGSQCRRIARSAYIWPNLSLFLCGVHGRGHDPLPERADPPRLTDRDRAVAVLDAAVARSRDSHELYRLNALRRWVLTGRLPERAA